MKFFSIILIMTISGYACHSLSPIEPIPLSEQKNYSMHYNPFLKGKYRLIHSIRAELPNGDITSIIGVTVADPRLKTIHAVIMTIEGLVLFDAIYKEKSIIINRGIPPFDSQDFATALIDDIKLIYFIPNGKNTESGMLNSDSYIKRYNCNDSAIIDVIANKDGTGVIKKYDSGYSLLRTVNISVINLKGRPDKIELIAHGFFGYSLYLELISIEEVSGIE